MTRTLATMASRAERDPIDAVVVGGGPAGLTAALYLARFSRNVRLVDRGGSRALSIPRSHNVPGYVDGISGADLLARMTKHAERYGAEIVVSEVTAIGRGADHWNVETLDGAIFARAVLIATGVVNCRPLGLDDAVHDAALAVGKLRYCPICDGFEAGGDGAARIAVVGAESHGVAEALFLRRFSRQVTLLAHKDCELHEKDRQELERSGVVWNPQPIVGYDFEGDAVTLTLADGTALEVDTLYPSLGSEPNVALIERLGMRTDPTRCILTDSHQRLGLTGLYAAGDVVAALDQISVAMGHGAIAATTIHNDLRERDGPPAR